MEKNLLIFIFTLLLSSGSSYADNENELPELPPAFEVQEEVPASPDGNKSFWQKIKTYIGFGEKEKVVEQQPSAPSLIEKTEDTTQTTESKPIDDKQPLVENNANISDSAPPIGSTDEGPAIVNLPKNSENEVDIPDQLKLPDGFGEDIVNKEGSSNSLSEPTQDISNLDDVAQKNNTTEDSKILNQTEAKTKIIQEIAVPKTEELNVPQLPEIPEDKANGADEAQTVQEVVEPKTKELSVPKLPEIPEDKANGAGEAQTVQEVVEPKTEELNVPQLPEIPEDKANGAEVKTEEESEEKDKPITKLELPSESVDTSTNSNLPIPEYANAATPLSEQEETISKYKKEFEAKSGKAVAVPKISESELSLKDKSKQIDLKASDLEEFDTKQLAFVNNEAQVLILPNDEIVLGALIEEARLDQMDFRSYMDIFWDNYNKLKREPKRLEVERFINNYDELFDTDSSFYEEK